MKKYIYVLLFIEICLEACSNKLVDIEGKVVDIDTVNVQRKEYTSSFYKKANVIVLDTMDVLLKDIVKLQVYDSVLYIMDETESIYAFNNKGKFICNIGQKGNGPGEYVQPTDFAIDPVSQTIYVLDFASQVIYTYNMETGKHLRTLKLDDENCRSRHIYYSENKLYTDLYPKGNGSYMIRQLGLPDGIVEMYLGDVEQMNRGWRRVTGKSPFYKAVDGGFYFIPSFSEGVYKVLEHKISPILTLCGESMMDLETFKSINFDNDNEIHRIVESNKIFNIGELVDRDTTIMFNYIQGNISNYVCATNNMNKLTRLQVILEDLVFLKEYDVYLDTRFACLETNNKGVYYYLNTFGTIDFLTHIKNGYLSPKLDNYSQLYEISEETNPIVIYYEY